jgi:formamidopyrimidine-DNA glycosylase
MPELGEVENYRRRWDAARGARVLQVCLHPRARIFAGTSTARLRRLAGEMLLGSEARGKWMSFRFTGGLWLGIHLGMTGRLWVQGLPPSRGLRGVVRVRNSGDRGAFGGHAVVADREPVRHAPARDPRHDHLKLVTEVGTFVFSDPRLFGRVRADAGEAPPSWWLEMPPSIVSDGFTVEAMREFLRRRARSPLKAVLLDQARFPGIGNWMADEVLWRAGLHPRRRAGDLDPSSTLRLYRTLRFVAGAALRRIGEENGALPRGWLFHHRWERSGRCPRTGAALVRETVGGRTTCWSPGRQSLAGARLCPTS